MGMPTFKTVVIINRFGMGEAEPILSHKLLDAYLAMLGLQSGFPDAIFCYGEGVKVACEGSPFLDALTALTQKGVYLGVCTTCLKHFHLMDKRKVGEAGKMEDVVKAQHMAEKVITL